MPNYVNAPLSMISGCHRPWKVYDTEGKWLRTCDSYKEAYSFCLSRGRLDWKIVECFK